MASITEEAERIRQCKGRVFALHDEPEVPRVWLPFDDAPGLAMARAFGDFCLKDYGVIAVPELSHRVLTDQDQFIVLATDGVCPQKPPSCFVLLKAAIVIYLSNSSADPIDENDDRIDLKSPSHIEQLQLYSALLNYKSSYIFHGDFADMGCVEQ
jgi:hypothetical protein